MCHIAACCTYHRQIHISSPRKKQKQKKPTHTHTHTHKARAILKKKPVLEEIVIMKNFNRRSSSHGHTHAFTHTLTSTQFKS